MYSYRHYSSQLLTKLQLPKHRNQKKQKKRRDHKFRSSISTNIYIPNRIIFTQINLFVISSYLFQQLTHSKELGVGVSGRLLSYFYPYDPLLLLIKIKTKAFFFCLKFYHLRTKISITTKRFVSNPPTFHLSFHLRHLHHLLTTHLIVFLFQLLIHALFTILPHPRSPIKNKPNPKTNTKEK